MMQWGFIDLHNLPGSIEKDIKISLTFTSSNMKVMYTLMHQ